MDERLSKIAWACKVMLWGEAVLLHKDNNLILRDTRELMGARIAGMDWPYSEGKAVPVRITEISAEEATQCK